MADPAERAGASANDQFYYAAFWALIRKMSLYVIATPIGNPKDIGYRAKALLQNCPVIIGEETRTLFRQLKSFGIRNIDQKEIHSLNEHSQTEQLQELVSLCSQKQIALISDCGTPAFCDPGVSLIQACYVANIPVRSVPGPSSLTAFLSICGRHLNEFVFQGFLPAKRPERVKAFIRLRKEKRPIILMDTPYRLKSLVSQLKEYLPHRRLVLGLSLSTDQEKVLFGRPAQVLAELPVAKAEFVLLLEKT